VIDCSAVIRERSRIRAHYQPPPSGSRNVALQSQGARTDDWPMDHSQMSSISVASPRRWFGNQTLGAYSIYVDGAAVGRVEPEGVLRIPCGTGRHVLRARQWWYFSPTISVSVEEGLTAHVVVDLCRRDSRLGRFFTLMFMPWRAVSLSPSKLA
jgi:hypothetical protein